MKNTNKNKDSKKTVPAFDKVTKNEEKSQEQKNTQNTTSNSKTIPRLSRSETDKVIGGVASGIARYLEIDPLIIRLIFLALIFGGGSGFLIYIVLWIILPSENTVLESSKEVINENVNEVKSQAEKVVGNVNVDNNTGKVILGSIIIFIGIISLLRIWNVYIDLSPFWPLLVIGLGIFIVVKK